MLKDFFLYFGVIFFYAYCFRPDHKPRTINFEKSSQPVGFQIQSGPAGGIFVSSVNNNSLASQAGLLIGHQLLEVSGLWIQGLIMPVSISFCLSVSLSVSLSLSSKAGVLTTYLSFSLSPFLYFSLS